MVGGGRVDDFDLSLQASEPSRGVGGILRILHLSEISALVHIAKMPLIKMKI